MNIQPGKRNQPFAVVTVNNSQATATYLNKDESPKIATRPKNVRSSFDDRTMRV